MKRMSLSDLRANLFQTFKQMQNGGVIEIYHRRKVYRLHVEITPLKITDPYIRKQPQGAVPTGLIETKTCPTCKGLLVHNICMNKKCDRATSPFSLS